MIPDGPDRSFLENHIEYRLPLGPFGRWFRDGVQRRLARMFAYRHALQASDLRRHGLYRDRPRMRIAITGSRGLIGSDLALFLATGGHSVLRLVHDSGGVKPPGIDDGTEWIGWNPQAPLDPAILDGCDAVVHLAGDNIGEGRWNEAKKRKILDSRTTPTRNLAVAIAVLPRDRRPRVLVSASAIGFYGERGAEPLTEDSLAGTGFFPEVCKAWEAAASPAVAAGVRVVHPRIGIVLSPQYGSLLMRRYVEALHKTETELGLSHPIQVAGAWHLAPALIEALAQQLLTALQSLGPDEAASAPVLLIAHSLPRTVADAEPGYMQQLQETAEAVAEAASLDQSRWQFVYQSAGHTREEWLRPDLVDVFPELSGQGHQSVVVAPVQFVADHLEVLYDIDVAAREQAAAAGLRLVRTQSLNTHPLFIEALAEVVRRETIIGTNP